jgi:hypothetical protein
MTREHQLIPSADAATVLRAGVAKSEITTEEKGVVINDPLYAKVLVLDDGTKQIAIIALDALAIGGIGDIGDDFLPKLRARIENELKIPSDHILVNASHTHPPGHILCDAETLINRTFDAVSRAFKKRMPVKVGMGSGREDRISMNRNLILKNGKHWTIRHANPDLPDDEIAGIEAIDPEIGVLRFDRLDGKPLAVVYNFACHLLWGDPQGKVTANIPGYASRMIEGSCGGMALFLQGAAGDVVDVNFKRFDLPRNIEPLGAMLGQSVLQVWRKIETACATLSVASQLVELPRRTDIPQRIAALTQEQDELLESLRTTKLNFKAFLPLYLKHKLNPAFPGDNIYGYWQYAETSNRQVSSMDAFIRASVDKYLANIYAMEKLVRIREDIATLKIHQAFNEASGEATITAEVMGLKIGDCVLVTAPLEALTEIGLKVKARSPYPHTFMAAFTNGYLQYGPPAAHYEKGGYEVTECFLAPEWQAIYEATAGEVISRL